MRWFADLKLFPKLMLSFAMILVLTALLAFFCDRQLSQVNDASTDLADNWMPASNAAAAMNVYAGDLRAAELEHILSNNAQDKGRFEQAMDKALQGVAKTAPEYEKRLTDQEEKALWASFKADWAAYVIEHEAFIRLSRENKHDEALALARGKALQLYEQASGTLDSMVHFNRKGGEAASDRADALYGSARWALAGAVMVTVVLGLSLAWYVSSLIVRPVRRTVEVLQAVSDGDLTQLVERQGADEIGDMQMALSTMIGSLSAMVQQVRSGAESVATASTQIAQGNTDLSGRTEEQASSLEETAASIEEMSGTVRTNADNANQANQLASAASSVAVRGGEVVSQVIETMNDIQSSSKKISDIIGVIDGIAFQTNILALNAAVEAARAGEQGRGFAVVAGEVRSLAQRSAQAAREIKTLINDSVEKVNAGSALVTTAGNTMGDVVTQVRKVTDLVGEIAHASTEQSQGIGQINQAVTQLDQVTQQNAALVEESMAAAESLKSQAQRLAQAVSVFRTRGTEHAQAQAQTQAQHVIQQVKQQSARPAMAASITPVTPVTAVKNGPVVSSAAMPSTPRPQLPAPQLSAKAAAVSASNDDWETF